MNSDSLRRTRRFGLGVIVALLVLAILSVTVWAAWAAPWRGDLLAALTAAATATPTRTPRPLTPAPTLVPTEIPVPLVVALPTQEPTPRPSPTPAMTPEPLPPLLAEVVVQYGMDPARRFIVVDQDGQRMYIWDPGRPVRELKVSTGDESIGYPTPPWYGLVGRYWGTFFGFGVWADEGWYLFDDPTGSNLIHSAPYRWEGGRKVYQGLDALGNYPASHGCIRLHPDDAAWFTAWGPQGVPIVILPKTAKSIPKG